jgi:YVTN family beta-propeller protein
MPRINQVRRRFSLMTCCFAAAALAGTSATRAQTTSFSGPGARVVATIPIIGPSNNPAYGGYSATWAAAGDVQINSRTNRVYVTGFESVWALDGDTDTIIASIPVPAALASTYGLAQSCVDDVTNTIYTIATNGAVTAIDGAANAVKASFSPIPSANVNTVDGIVCNPESGKLYMVVWPTPASGLPATEIIAWDIRGQKILASIPYPGNAAWLAVNRKTNRIYAPLTLTGTMVVIDGATDKVIDTINVGQPPAPPGCAPYVNCVTDGSILENVAVDEATNRIYVTGAFDGSLATIDGETNKVVDRKYLADALIGVAVDPVSNAVYAGDPDLGVLAVVNGATNQRSANVSVGGMAFPLVASLGD